MDPLIDNQMVTDFRKASVPASPPTGALIVVNMAARQGDDCGTCGCTGNHGHITERAGAAIRKAAPSPVSASPVRAWVRIPGERRCGTERVLCG